jgi:Nuclease-related domain/UvrD-like helicase C-terminal domain/PhoH-like protein
VPRMIPGQAHPESPPSEKRVFELLKAIQERPAWTVLHSLGLSSGYNGHHGEIDFLVVVPGQGLLCLEVKGGGVSCADGRWSTIDRNGRRHELGRSPIEQAKQGIWKLRAALDKRFGHKSPEAACPIGWLLVLPDIPCLPPSPEFTRQEIVDMHDLRGDLSARIETAPSLRVDAASRGKSSPNKAVTDRLVEFLRPSFDRVPTVASARWDTERRIRELTQEQFSALDATNENAICAILGPAGTGKTLLAIEAARRESMIGRRTLVGCYNRYLGRWLSHAVDAAKSDGPIVGTSLHGYLRARILASSLGPDFLSMEKHQPPSLYSDDYFEFGALAIDELGDRFDTVILDEVQDFSAAALRRLTDAWSSGTANTKILLLGDFARQAIYSSVGSTKTELVTTFPGVAIFNLSLNCRNTQMIAKQLEFATGSVGLKVSEKAPEGEAVQYFCHTSDSQMYRNLEIALAGLKDQGVKAEDIAVLFQRRPTEDGLRAAGRASRWRLNEYDETSPGAVLWTTIHAFKGLESQVVVLADVKSRIRDEIDSLLYVGMSRARTKLIVLCDEESRASLDQRIIQHIAAAAGAVR